MIRKLAIAPFLWFVFSACVLLAQQALTNDSIIKLVKAGLSEDMIINMVNSQPGNYALGADDIVALKGAGVAEPVIGAMMKRSPVTAPAAAPIPAPAPAPAPSVPSSASPQSLRSVRKIFIDKMDNELDQYLRAEVSKQFKGSVVVVLTREEADGILAGVSEEQKGTGAKVTGRYLGLHDVATGTISLLDREGKTILWSDEAGDRSLFWGPLKRGGQRKVADRLVSKLKKAMEGAR